MGLGRWIENWLSIKFNNVFCNKNKTKHYFLQK